MHMVRNYAVSMKRLFSLLKWNNLVQLRLIIGILGEATGCIRRILKIMC